MPSCICGNFISQSSYSMNPQFSLDLCTDCLKAGNSPSYWNSKEYEHADATDDSNLYNKEFADN